MRDSTREVRPSLARSRGPTPLFYPGRDTFDRNYQEGPLMLLHLDEIDMIAWKQLHPFHQCLGQRHLTIKRYPVGAERRVHVQRL